MAAKAKVLGTFLALALGGLMGTAQMGCLNPEQRLALVQFDRALMQDQATLINLRAELEKYQVDLKAIFGDIKAGKVPYETGLVLASKVIANISDTQKRMAEIEASVTGTAVAIKRVQDAGVPWYYYALPVGTAAVGVVSMFVPGLSPLVQALQSTRGQLTAAVVGVEQFRKAPDDDPRDIENFIADASQMLSVKNELHATVKSLTGTTGMLAK